MTTQSSATDISGRSHDVGSEPSSDALAGRMCSPGCKPSCASDKATSTKVAPATVASVSKEKGGSTRA